MKEKYLKNTAILFVSMIITKVVGAVFKIPLANLLGGTGMGYFSTAYGLYSPVFALTAAGVPTVLMRITAQCAAREKYSYAAAVKRTATLLFTGIGLIGTITVALFAKPFAEHIAYSGKSTLAILCISPAVALCCAASVIRGYYEGLSNVLPTAAASVTEAASRAVFGLSLSYAVLFFAKYRFENGLDVFGESVSTASGAYEAALPYAAAGAVLAVSISELCGLITLIIADRKRGGVKCEKIDRIGVCRRLIAETAPIAASALVMNCVSFVDLLTVTRTLSYSVETAPDFYGRAFSEVMPYSDGLAGLPNFMYGSYTGIAMSLFMLIPSFAGMAEKTLDPEIAAAWERRDDNALCGNIFKLFRTAAVIGAPACFGAAALAGPILNMLYRSRAAEVSVCRSSFVILCVGGIFMVISSAAFGVFQSICKARVPLILMICSVGIKFLLNPILISIPSLNISGAAISSAVGYAVMAVGGIAALKKCVWKKIGVLKAVAPPVICALACGLSAKVGYFLLEKELGSTASTVISIIFGGFVYVILLIVSGVFRTSGIIKPKIEKKIKKPLAKYKKIG